MSEIVNKVNKNKGQFIKGVVYGVGIDDTEYQKERRIYSGNTSKVVWYCPTYSTWRNMLRRCYHSPYKSYRDVYVCHNWLVFSNFKSWYESNELIYGRGLHLDKDMLKHDNKIYSPHTCCLLPSKINTFITVRGRSCNTLIGAYYEKDRGMFQSYCNTFMGKRKSLGRYKTELEANLEWQKERASQLEICSQWYVQNFVPNPRVLSSISRMILGLKQTTEEQVGVKRNIW